MTDELKAQLTRLMADTNAAIATARDKCIEDAVNWADLKCIAAEQVTGIARSGDAYAGFGITIEEASPEAHRFRAFISDQLAAAGWERVGVTTEW